MANQKLENLEGALEAVFKQYGNGASLFNGGVSPRTAYLLAVRRMKTMNQ